MHIVIYSCISCEYIYIYVCVCVCMCVSVCMCMLVVYMRTHIFLHMPQRVFIHTC